MFNDLRISTDTMTAYKAFTKTQNINSQLPEISVRVLTPTNWPTNNDDDFQLDPNLLNLKQEFESWYLTKHTGRKLAWPSYIVSSLCAIICTSDSHKTNDI